MQLRGAYSVLTQPAIRGVYALMKLLDKTMAKERARVVLQPLAP